MSDDWLLNEGVSVSQWVATIKEKATAGGHIFFSDEFKGPRWVAIVMLATQNLVEVCWPGGYLKPWPGDFVSLEKHRVEIGADFYPLSSGYRDFYTGERTYATLIKSRYTDKDEGPPWWIASADYESINPAFEMLQRAGVEIMWVYFIRIQWASTEKKRNSRGVSYLFKQKKDAFRVFEKLKSDSDMTAGDCLILREQVPLPGRIIDRFTI